MEHFLHWFDLLGIAVFAASGTLAAWRKQMDGFGVIVLATVTAVGGGTIRDVILDVPVIWLTNNSYFYAIFIAAAITILLVRNRLTIPNNAFQIADAIGLAFFVIMGCQKALDHGTSPFVANHDGSNEWRLWRHDPGRSVQRNPFGISRRTICSHLYLRRSDLYQFVSLGSWQCNRND